jgi:hypothetical protein
MTVPLFLQGAEEDPVLLPAEDARVELGALLTQHPTDLLRPLSGILPGPARGAVTAQGIYVRVAPFAVSLAMGGGGQGTYVAALRAAKLLTPTTLPGASTYAAGLVCARVRDELYDGGSDSDLDVFLVMGANAATQGSVVAPALPANSFLLQTVTYGSAGPVAVGSYVPPLTVAVGGIRPVQASDTTAGAYDGQYRDHPVAGLQRWNAAAGEWRPAQPGGLIAHAEFSASASSTTAALAPASLPPLTSTNPLLPGRLYLIDSAMVDNDSTSQVIVAIRAKAGTQPLATPTEGTVVASFGSTGGSTTTTFRQRTDAFQVTTAGIYTFQPVVSASGGSSSASGYWRITDAAGAAIAGLTPTVVP